MVGGIYHTTLRSRFASGLQISIINEIHIRGTNKLCEPKIQYLKTLQYQTEDKNRASNEPSQL